MAIKKSDIINEYKILPKKWEDFFDEQIKINYTGSYLQREYGVNIQVPAFPAIYNQAVITLYTSAGWEVTFHARGQMDNSAWFNFK